MFFIQLIVVWSLFGFVFEVFLLLFAFRVFELVTIAARHQSWVATPLAALPEARLLRLKLKATSDAWLGVGERLFFRALAADHPCCVLRIMSIKNIRYKINK